jgi:hypothetical protein
MSALDPASAEEAVDEALSWPFVVNNGDEFQIVAGFETALAQSLRASDPDAFVSAHAFFADLEKGRQSVHAEDRWLARSRVAYYTAPLDERESVTEFEAAFRDAPIMDRTWHRIWLADLVERQVDVFGEKSRIVSFHRGFQLYVAGRRDDALKAFNSVTSAGTRDSYDAIALHLAALCESNRDSDAVVAKLRLSINRSERLRLDDNLLRARNSLVWTLIRRSSKHPHELASARKEAAVNLRLLDKVEEPKHFAPWLLLASAVTKWISVVGPDHRQVTRAESLFVVGEVRREFAEALTAADIVDDRETALRALNERACVSRDIGWYEDAVEDIAEAALRAQRVDPDAQEIDLLLKTSGSLRSHVRSDRQLLAVLNESMHQLEQRSLSHARTI